MLSEISIDLVYQFMLIFCRIGAAMMMLPAISESYISARSRLIVGVIISFILVPIIGDSLPALSSSAISLIILITKELIIGFFIGSVAKIILSAMHTAGMIMGYQSGLATASLFDPGQGGQSSIFGIFLTFVTVLIIFVTNMHHLFLQGAIDSYNLFPPGDIIPTRGFMEMISKTTSSAFLTGFKIAAPHIVIGLILYLGAGVMGRLMPQMQVFFILLPIQILAGFFLLMITLSATMIWFTDYYIEIMGSLIYFGENS